MHTEIEGIKFYTVPEVAKALRATPQTIRAYIKQGRESPVSISDLGWADQAIEIHQV